MPFHLDKQCSMTGSPCENCEEMKYNNRRGKHDCIATLKENLRKAREEIASLKVQGKSPHVQNDNCLTCITCNGPHGLARHSGPVEEYNGNPNCDLCGQDDLQTHEFFYRCARCQYDVC